jgi:hypothetical protein
VQQPAAADVDRPIFDQPSLPETGVNVSLSLKQPLHLGASKAV